MGVYATTTSISILLPGFLREDTTTTDAQGKRVFDAHINRAEALVNGYLAQRYQLPFVSVPPVVRTLTEDLACYYALRGTLNQDTKEKNPYLDEYETVIEFLKDIASGENALTLTDGSILAPLSTNRFVSSTQPYARIFGMDDATQWRRDPTEVAEQEAQRNEQ